MIVYNDDESDGENSSPGEQNLTFENIGITTIITKFMAQKATIIKSSNDFFMSLVE